MNISKFTTAIKPFIKSDHITITTTMSNDKISGFTAYMPTKGRKEFKVKGSNEDAMLKAWKELEKWVGVIKI